LSTSNPQLYPSSGASLSGQNGQYLPPRRQQEFKFKLCYRLACHSAKSSSQFKEEMLLKSRVRAGSSGEAIKQEFAHGRLNSEIEQMMQELRPNDTIVWSNSEQYEFTWSLAASQQ